MAGDALVKHISIELLGIAGVILGLTGTESSFGKH
jgi:hypothetical protein